MSIVPPDNVHADLEDEFDDVFEEELRADLVRAGLIDAA